MKKIAIISVADRRHMTMVSAYTDLFDRDGIAYDVICMDRYGETVAGNEDKLYAFSFADNMKSSKKKKLIMFLRFLLYAVRIIRREKYGFLVIWNENTAALFAPFLALLYAKKYCVNQRDIDFMARPLVTRLYCFAVKRSAYSTSCAPYTVENVPKGYPYVKLVSKNNGIIAKCVKRDGITHATPIVVSFIGKVRFRSADRELIDALANDERFELRFIGAGSEMHRDYIEEKGVRNAKLVGRYLPEETVEFLDQADILDGYYGTDFPFYQHFAPIRFGYAPALNIPIIVTSGTFMDEVGSQYGFSFAVNKASLATLADDLYRWYTQLDFAQFAKGCAAYCAGVDETNRRFEETCIRTVRACIC